MLRIKLALTPGTSGVPTGRRPLRPLPPPGWNRPVGYFKSVAHLITGTAVEEDLSIAPTRPDAYILRPASGAARYPELVPHHRDPLRHGQRGTA